MRFEGIPSGDTSFCGTTGLEKSLCGHCEEARREASGLLLKTGARFVPKEADPNMPLIDADKGIDAMRRKAFAKEASLAVANMDEATLADVIDAAVTPEATKKADTKQQVRIAATLDTLREAVVAEREAMMNEENMDQRQLDDAAIAKKGENRVALERVLPKIAGSQLDDALRLLKDVAAMSIKRRAARPPQAKAS